MEDRELEALLTDLESDRVERKSSISDRDDVRKAICALANDLPGHRKQGVCFVGVDDRGRCAQTPITDQLLLMLANFRSDGNLLPFPTRPDYPIVALQQLARNAVLHRAYEGTNAPVRVTWFNDRIEIQNPGGPYGQVNRENFGAPGITDYRNPHLAEAMKNLGYVQRFGVGIQIARREMEKNGNPPPEFVTEAGHVLAVLKGHA